MESADVVVIGGGAIGAATAFHLNQLGVTDVVVVERDTLASGSTSKSAGGVRYQFADELNVRIMDRALPEFEHFAAMIGEHSEYVPDIGFHQVGYLFLITNPDDLAVFQTSVELQQSLGLDTRWITNDEAAALTPGVVYDDVIAATFNPREGYCSPEAVVLGYAAAARALGTRVFQNRSVTGLTVDRQGTISAVETSSGPIATNTVVVAAGAWSSEVGKMAGVDIQVTGLRRHMWFSPEPGGLPRHCPMTIDFSTSFYFHPEGPGLVFGGPHQTLEEVAVEGVERLPALAELPIARTWSGFYDLSPDHNAIVGKIGAVTGLFVGTGFSGHGFQQAPAIGEHLAQLIAGVTPSIDLTAFTPDRFDRGEHRVERFVI